MDRRRTVVVCWGEDLLSVDMTTLARAEQTAKCNRRDCQRFKRRCIDTIVVKPLWKGNLTPQREEW